MSVSQSHPLSRPTHVWSPAPFLGSGPIRPAQPHFPSNTSCSFPSESERFEQRCAKHFKQIAGFLDEQNENDIIKIIECRTKTDCINKERKKTMRKEREKRGSWAVFEACVPIRGNISTVYSSQTPLAFITSDYITVFHLFLCLIIIFLVVS